MRMKSIVLPALASILFSALSAQSARESDPDYGNQRQEYLCPAGIHGQHDARIMQYRRALRAARFRAMEDGFVSRRERKEIDLLRQLACLEERRNQRRPLR